VDTSEEDKEVQFYTKNDNIKPIERYLQGIKACFDSISYEYLSIQALTVSLGVL